MKNLSLLFRFKFRYNMGLTQLAAYMRTGPKAVLLSVLGMLLAAMILAGFGFVYVAMVAVVQMVTLSMGAPELMPKVMLTMGQILLIFTGLFSAFNMMFGGKDRDFMASLPIKGGYVFFVNLALTYLIEAAFSAILVLPVLILYASCCGGGVLFWVYGILGVFLFPVFPLCVSSIIMMAIMLAAGRFRHKELFVTLFSFLLIFAVFFGNMALNSGSVEGIDGTQAVQSFLSGRIELVHTASLVFPGAAFLSGALTQTGIAGLLYFLGLLGLAGFFFVLCLWFGDHKYYQVLQRMGGTGARRRRKLTGRDFTGRGPEKAFFVKEWRLVLRSPVFAVNGLFHIIMGPALLLFVFLGKGETSLEPLYTFLEKNPSAAVCAIIAMTVLLSGMGMVSATTISREGPAFWICKTVPVPVKCQIKGRLWAGYTVYLLCAVPMLVLFQLFLSLELLPLLAVLLICLPAGLAVTGLHIGVDLARPKLVWSQEAEAMKQNVNGMIGMLLSVLLAIVLALPVGLSAVGLWRQTVGYGISTLLCGGAAAGSFFGVLRYGERRFPVIW